MAKTNIPWTDFTFNPWWGCQRVSPGCVNCYAEAFAKRTGHDVWGPAKTSDRRTFGVAHWNEPRKWNAAAKEAGVRRRVFCASMADVFEDHPEANHERHRLWALMQNTPWLDWQVLTKRPENIAAMLPPDWGEGYPNVWLGTSVEDQQRADERIPVLLDVPARVRFLSCEPLLGPVALSQGWCDYLAGWTTEQSHVCGGDEERCHRQCPEYTQVETNRIGWVIVGGESGGQRRPMEMEWLRLVVDDCRAASVAVFVKQDNAFKPDQRGRIPDDLWIREFPTPPTESDA